MKRKSRWIVLLSMVALGLGGAGAAVFASQARPAGSGYQTAAVSKGRVVARVTASGTVSALVTVQVGSQVSGRLQEVLVDFNSPVKKGQVIARIDPEPFKAALEMTRANARAARANLQRSRVQLADAERQLARADALRVEKLIGQAERDTAQTAADLARAAVAASLASLDQAAATERQAGLNLTMATITSPIDGVVISRSVDAGQTVAASLSAPTLFTIAGDLTKMQVDSSVSEGDVGRLEAGMKATFTVDAFPGETFEGAVRQVRNAAQTVQNVVTYDAVIDVANPARKLKPGMTATVTFIVARRDDVVTVPNAALRFRAAPTRTARSAETRTEPRPDSPGRIPAAAREERKTVWVLRGTPQVLTAVRVQTGLTDGRVTEVVSGDLQLTDLLVVADLSAPDAAPAPSSTTTPARSPLTGTGGGGGRTGRMF